jgi:hypothetical protein
MAKLNDEQRRALQLLARHPVGCAEVALLAEGFSVGQLATLVMDGFAKRRPIVTNVGRREKIVLWMQITDAGRAALADEEVRADAPVMMPSCPILHRRQASTGANLIRGTGQRRVAMNDAQRYRMNAAECLSAADRCELPYRRPAVAIAEAWSSLARHEEAMNELLAIWSKASAPTSASEPQSFILSTFTGPHSPLPLAGRYVAISSGLR